MTLSQNSLSAEQRRAITRLVEYDETILVAPTGEGKTVICLSAMAGLITMGEYTRFIVACPPKVMSVWPKEINEWSHLSELRAVTLSGGPKARTKALEGDLTANVIVVSLNNLDWLLQQDHGADGIVIDELSKAAGKQSAKLKTKKWGAALTWRVGMTATPVSQNFEKLYAMCRVVDGGKCLGTSKARYLDQYFNADWNGHSYTLRDGADALILDRVSSLIHLIVDTKADKLPPIEYHTIRFDMPDDTRAVYDEMKKEMVAADVAAVNEAVKSGKLRQIASGFMYREDGTAQTFDTARWRNLELWMTSLGDRRGIIFYEFVEQRPSAPEITYDVDDFKRGGWPILAAQINSLSHGVDGLQHVCADALFLHPMWSRDAQIQAAGRLHRTGQTHPVRITTLVCNDTLDDAVMARVEGNARWMELLTEHLRGEG
jgi:SNF2 family DNA or RNA helicase